MSQAKRSVFREYFEALVVAGLFLGFTNTFVLKTFYIPSGSMEDTLLIGDHLFVNRYLYGPTTTKLEQALFPSRKIRRGDIVIFRSPETPEVDLVKRCVALPGDEVEVIDKELWINGEKVEDSSYASRRDPRVLPRRSRFSKQTIPRDNYGPLTIPESNYFCMGDNRDHSHDSRFWGTLPEHYVKGRAFMIYWSYGGGTSDGNWYGWGERLKQLGKTTLGFATKTRWRRTLKIIR